MTEEEAKTKWCPFARSRSIEYGKSQNLMGYTTYMAYNHDVPTTTCIASECMAWREIHYDPKYEVKDRCGYCGLAGKP